MKGKLPSDWKRLRSTTTNFVSNERAAIDGAQHIAEARKEVPSIVGLRDTFKGKLGERTGFGGFFGFVRSVVEHFASYQEAFESTVRDPTERIAKLKLKFAAEIMDCAVGPPVRPGQDLDCGFVLEKRRSDSKTSQVPVWHEDDPRR